MSDYTKATNFATKDSLATGNPGKIIKGTEIDAEFNAISSAITSKAEQSDIDASIAALTGRIVQQVSAVFNSTSSTTGTTFVNSNVTASITPTNASSKILILVSASQRIYDYTTEMNTQIVRNGSTQVEGSYKILKAWLSSEGTGKEIWIPSSMAVIDSPATLSTTSYTVQFKCQGYSGGTVTYGSGDTNASVIHLLEIL